MDHVRRWRLIVGEYSPTIYYFKSYHNIIVECFEKFLCKTPVATIIETFFLMKKQFFSLAIAKQLTKPCKRYEIYIQSHFTIENISFT